MNNRFTNTNLKCVDVRPNGTGFISLYNPAYFKLLRHNFMICLNDQLHTEEIIKKLRGDPADRDILKNKTIVKYNGIEASAESKRIKAILTGEKYGPKSSKYRSIRKYYNNSIRALVAMSKNPLKLK